MIKLNPRQQLQAFKGGIRESRDYYRWRNVEKVVI